MYTRSVYMHLTSVTSYYTMPPVIPIKSVLYVYTPLWRRPYDPNAWNAMKTFCIVFFFPFYNIYFVSSWNINHSFCSKAYTSFSYIGINWVKNEKEFKTLFYDYTNIYFIYENILQSIQIHCEEGKSVGIMGIHRI